MARDTARQHAELVAEAYVRKDLAFRSWITRHGGVYVPPSAETPPNPYLAGVPERDVTTTGGKQLTLVNPAYATRQVLEAFAASDGIRGKLTSLRLKNPVNAPEAWEREALAELERGARKYSALDTDNGGPVLRYMLPVYMEPGCMACHADLGIPVGGLRGGFSVSMPLAPFERRAAVSRQLSISGHAALWLLGVGMLGFARRRAHEQQEREQVVEHSRRQRELCGAVLLDISTRSAHEDESHWIAAGVEAAQQITGSAVAYLHFIHADQQTIAFHAWSEAALAQCRSEPPRHQPLDKAGVWADCVRLKRPVIHNDYDAEQRRRKLPEGHIALARHLGVPALEGNAVCMVIGVGNKAQPYDHADVEVLQTLADGLWGIITQARAGRRLRDSERMLREAQELARLGSWELDLVSGELSLSHSACALIAPGRPCADEARCPLTLDDLRSLRSAEDWETDLRRLRSQINTDGTLDLEVRQQPPGGEARLLRLRGSVVRAPDGKLLRAAGTVQDVTTDSELDLLRISTTNLSVLFESTDRIIWSVDRDLRLIIANQAALRFFVLRFGRRMLAGDACQPLADDERERWKTLYAEARAGRTVSIDLDPVASDPRWLEMHLTPGGKDGVIIVHGNDLTERKRAELERVDALRRMQEMIDRLADRDRDNGLINRLHDLLQSCRSEAEARAVIAPLFAELFGNFDAALMLVDDHNPVLRVIARAGEPAIPDGFALDDCWALRRGELHEIQARGAPLCAHFSTPPTSGYCCQPMMVDADVVGLLTVRFPAAMDEQMRENIHYLVRSTADAVKLSLSNLRLREALREQAIHDPLTGLYNRRYFNDILGHELVRAERDGTPMTLAMLDIDHFKRFNDDYGHEAGDIVLAGIGRLLREKLRRSDVPCRFGGEELAIVMPASNADNARERLESLCREIAGLALVFHDQPLPAVTLSAGIAQAPEHGNSNAQLVHAADLALYQAKAEGRNRIVIATAAAD